MKIGTAILSIVCTGMGAALASMAIDKWERQESQYGAYSIVQQLMERGAIEAQAGPVERDRLRKACGGRAIGVFFSFRTSEHGRINMGLACRDLWETWTVTQINPTQAQS